jgi:hypothetical protein
MKLHSKRYAKRFANLKISGFFFLRVPAGEWYITHPSLRLKTASLYKAKFNEEHPSITKMHRKAEKAKAKAEKQAAAATGAVPPPNPVFQHGGDLESLEVSAANAELEAANAQQP